MKVRRLWSTCARTAWFASPEGQLLRVLCRSILLLALGVTFALPVLGSGRNTDRFSISLGAFITDRDTDSRLDSVAGQGTAIDFEKDLGLDASGTVLRLDGYYRFNRRHRIDFAVFDLSRDASATIDEQIDFGDETFGVNTTVSAEFDLLIVKAAYTWSVFDRNNGYLGLTAGLYTADTKSSLSEPTLGVAETRSITAPLPVVGLRGEYQLSQWWTLRGSAEFFAIEVDNVDGQLTDLHVGIDYRPAKRWAVGLGYNSVRIEVDSTKAAFTGSLDWAYDGALLYLKLGFGAIN